MDPDLPSRHRGLIDGLANFYHTLIRMQYLEASDVIRPPHPQELVDTARLQRLGLDLAVIELAALLPALRNEVVWGYSTDQGTQIAPRSKAVNYFVQPPGTAGDRLQDDLPLADRISYDDAPRLPPWFLRLSFGGSNGVNLLYDVRDETITEWPSLEGPYHDALPRRPADDVLASMLERLSSLDWVPSVSPADDDEEPPRRELVDNPLILQNAFPGGLRFADATNFAAAVEQVRATSVTTGDRDPEVDVVAFREQVNRWRALQKLYRDCGWPGEGFRGDELRARMGEWVRRAEEVRYELYAVLGGPAPTTEETRARREHVTRRWEAFWAEAAGEGFV